jgi:hypothetical protein
MKNQNNANVTVNTMYLPTATYNISGLVKHLSASVCYPTTERALAQYSKWAKDYKLSAMSIIVIKDGERTGRLSVRKNKTTGNWELNPNSLLQ